ncbi:hypothetical protein BDY21DRAFT_366953 [Lineolata rhizophorae]|uniref:N-acetylgalactosaminide beta-1,3-galactosyltransferase n=1 Tax=Lineolata rhizophorae TaxID=578093 RepID=A0A6A6NNV6_9PEZI|nr:hypothetical protein BDY21DRAFT_366953 [Lineolata rhizophorae]
MASSVLVILKTGATEAPLKLPVHANTTFRCTPNHVVYSDLAETIAGIPLEDVLADVSPAIRASHPDFALYEAMHAPLRAEDPHGPRKGRAALDDAAAAATAAAAWTLDKWKFLPLARRALARMPAARWFVLVEADTYVVWPSLFDWLAGLDPDQAMYAGAPTQIGDVTFAHGGSGVVVSGPAMRRLVETVEADGVAAWEDVTTREWAGDCVLGKALGEAGVGLTWTWPLTQGRRPGSLDYGSAMWGRRAWCYPAVFYHHVDAREIEGFWEWEQEWYSRGLPRIRHSDVFADYIAPRLATAPEPSRDDWDNRSDYAEAEGFQTHPANASSSDGGGCARRCADWDECLQWELKGGTCFLAKVARLGNPVVGSSAGGVGVGVKEREGDGEVQSVRSGWMVERILKRYGEQEECAGEEWVV